MTKIVRRTVTMTEDKQFFILKRLAELETMPGIVKAFFAEYGERITIQTVRSYDPRDWHANRYAKDNAELFAKVRQNMIDQISSIPIANRVYRVAELQQIYEDTKGTKDFQTGMRALEIAAKEVGNVYTSVRTVDTRISFESWSDSELNKRITELCGGAENVPKFLRSAVIEGQLADEPEPDLAWEDTDGDTDGLPN